MDNDKLLKIYELSLNEGLTLFKCYEQRLSFFTGLILAIIGGIVFCFVEIGLSITFLIIYLIGLILLILISEISIWSLKRLYIQLLENITVRSKIEHDLGLTLERKESKSNKNKWDGWKPEPYILKRHIESRKDYSTSEKFVECEGKIGYQHKIRKVIRFIYITCIIIFIITKIIYICNLA